MQLKKEEHDHEIKTKRNLDSFYIKKNKNKRVCINNLTKERQEIKES